MGQKAGCCTQWQGPELGPLLGLGGGQTKSARADLLVGKEGKLTIARCCYTHCLLWFSEALWNEHSYLHFTDVETAAQTGKIARSYPACKWLTGIWTLGLFDSKTHRWLFCLFFSIILYICRLGLGVGGAGVGRWLRGLQVRMNDQCHLSLILAGISVRL